VVHRSAHALRAPPREPAGLSHREKLRPYFTLRDGSSERQFSRSALDSVLFWVRFGSRVSTTRGLALDRGEYNKGRAIRDSPARAWRRKLPQRSNSNLDDIQRNRIMVQESWGEPERPPDSRSFDRIDVVNAAPIPMRPHPFASLSSRLGMGQSEPSPTPIPAP
jgi:hypothetical protein